MGDCCNADIFENPVLGNDVIRPKGGGVLGDFNVESGSKLIFPPAPVAIIIGSVKQGHLSVGHPDIGAYYTHFFTTQLEKIYRDITVVFNFRRAEKAMHPGCASYSPHGKVPIGNQRPNNAVKQKMTGAYRKQK